VADSTNSTVIDIINSTNVTPQNTTDTSITLNGTGDVITVIQEDLNQNLDQITLSVWIEPDYSQGSPEFTILSKENSFILSVNNIITPQHVTKLSVFDGIKWTEIVGTTEIEGLSHVAAVLNGTELSLYVNGTLDAQGTLPEKFVISTKAEIDSVTSEINISNSTVVIGATVQTIREETKEFNYFSGTIHDIVIYVDSFTEQQIIDLFNKGLLVEPEIMPETEISQINATAIELEVNPELKPLQESYLITEDVVLEFEYYDEYDVLMAELAEIDNATQSVITEVEQSLTEAEIELGVVNATYTEPPVNATSTEPVVEEPVVNATSLDVAAKFLGYLSVLFEIPNADAAESTEEDKAKEEIAELKEEIAELKEEIAELKQSEDLDEEEIEELKQQLKEVVDQIKTTGEQLYKSDLTQEGNKLLDSANNIEEITADEDNGTVQQGTWNGLGETIETIIYDPEGNVISTNVQYEKMRDGKFSIKLDFGEYNKPGVYKVKTILTVNGETFVSESEFGRGLVSLNTVKSIYKPGETADFVIVVLDNGGHPVCDSNLFMSITSPDSQITNLSSGNGITANEECGLYDTQFTTSAIGTHNVEISAKALEINTNFSTTFDVQENFEFDIVRTAQSKIDPINNPNEFDVRINIESFVGSDSVEIKEFVPSIFEVVTDATMQTVGDTKILTWNKELIGDKTFVEYSYSIPLVFPQLYALGPTEINYGNLQTFTEARPWFVAADPIPISSLTLDVKKGTFTRSTALGLQSVNVGFTPEVVIFWGTNKVTEVPNDPGEGFSSDASHFQGFMASKTEQRAIASFGNDGGAGHKIDNKAIVIIKNNVPDVAADADFDSFDADGFTINWTKNDGVNNIIHYQAIGGSDLTDIKVGHFVGEEGEEVQRITDVGFEPTEAIALCSVALAIKP